MSLIPKHLRYTQTHEWVDERFDEPRVGITDHAQQLLGDLVFVELPEVGQEVSAGDEIGVLESVKAAADYYAPASGIITAVNQNLIDNPALLNQDPYGEGWLVTLSVNNPESVSSLLNASEYNEVISKEH